LLLFTVVGFLASWALSAAGNPTLDREPARAELAAAEASPSATPSPTVDGPPPAAEAGRKIERRHVIGVVTFNEYRKLTVGQATEDALSITGRDPVDVIGWQEAYSSAPVFATLRKRGWDTKAFPRGAQELAVSWRRSEFELVSSRARLVASGMDPAVGRYPFRNRFVVRVTLRHRDTGRLLSVINTHLPQKIEDFDRPGRWTTTGNAIKAQYQLDRMTWEWEHAPGRWVVGTGDYNVDARVDARLGLPRGPRDELGDLTVPSYARLGIQGLPPTHPPTGRLIDYVHAKRADLSDGRMRFVSQRVLGSLWSDHNALLVRIELL
jgi:endonuclease/exonuclease/phosphatase family metal-dependent hydrolase